MKNPEAKSMVLQDPDVVSMDIGGFSRIYGAASVRDSSLDRWRWKWKGLITGVSDRVVGTVKVSIGSFSFLSSSSSSSAPKQFVSFIRNRTPGEAD